MLNTSRFNYINTSHLSSKNRLYPTVYNIRRKYLLLVMIYCWTFKDKTVDECRRLVSCRLKQNLQKVIYWKYGKENGKLLYDHITATNKVKGTLKRYIEKYGEEEGTRKYKEKNAKLSVSVESLKRNGYSDEEIQQIKNKHSNKSLHNLQNFIYRYGEEEGKQRYNIWKNNSRLRSHRCVEFWMNKGYSLFDAMQKVSDGQRRDLAFYCKKYGEEEGTKKFNEMHKFKQEVGKRCAKINFRNVQYYPTSKAQQQFATKIYDLLDEKYKHYWKGRPYNDSIIIEFPENEFNKQFAIPDILIGNVIIEYNGDRWHSGDEKEQSDRERTLLLEQLGYKVIAINSLEYEKNKPICLQKIINFITINYDENFKNNKITN